MVALLQRLRARNLPERIDAEYLRDAGVSEGTISRTLFGLRLVGLITEEGEPTQALRSMHTSTDEEYRSILAGLIREAYREVFDVVDPAKDSQDRILNVFRRYTPASQRARMMIFFLGMCREAGIPTLDVPRQRVMAGARRTTTAPRQGSDGEVAVAGALGSRVRERPMADGHTGLPPALEGLVRSLPTPGTPLSKERRAQWIAMAEATLAFVYPEEKAAAEDMTEEDDAE
jgi:hypothetical protein